MFKVLELSGLFVFLGGLAKIFSAWGGQKKLLGCGLLGGELVSRLTLCLLDSKHSVHGPTTDSKSIFDFVCFQLLQTLPGYPTATILPQIDFRKSAVGLRCRILFRDFYIKNIELTYTVIFHIHFFKSSQFVSN